MKKFLLAVLLVLTAISLVACSVTWQDSYAKGMDALASENYSDAINSFSAAIDLQPDAVIAYIGRAEAYYYTEDYENALKDCEKAISLDDDSVLAHELMDKIPDSALS